MVGFLVRRPTLLYIMKKLIKIGNFYDSEWVVIYLLSRHVKWTVVLPFRMLIENIWEIKYSLEIQITWISFQTNWLVTNEVVDVLSCF